MDPPPDLAIEVDITHSSLEKLDLYAAMGVPELWVYDGERVSVFWGDGNTMTAREWSRAFATVRADILGAWMQQGKRLPRIAWNRAAREWAGSLQWSRPS